MDKFFGNGKKWKSINLLNIPPIIITPIFSPKNSETKKVDINDYLNKELKLGKDSGPDSILNDTK